MGERSFKVSDPGLYEAGDNIVIVHPCTAEWLEAIGGGGTAGDPPWQPGEQPIVFNRVIESIDGDELTIEVPLYYQLDRKLSQSYVYIADREHIVQEIGIEDLNIIIEPTEGSLTSHAKNGIDLIGLENGWVKKLQHIGFSIIGDPHSYS